MSVLGDELRQAATMLETLDEGAGTRLLVQALQSVGPVLRLAAEYFDTDDKLDSARIAAENGATASGATNPTEETDPAV